ncbi:RNA polymerase sigma-70 factor (sigma-E family) [Allocatelliglobosispora scoriae]|uniref:RNA polymerase sigma-70 factor (Sigma-E family) n=1 Tax=Allocatelliglobosispora scoriae TaxID=643052 RepID=A0A841BRS6_9ACTN|nr:SigE family RNA polymerase sigma factor [Allocatelliglobosispora scoriae]MBB5869613.1 RNA polymerase sigma-70 factor (sigma-E family) [Allocatelliglobosispora scoriae]
MREIASGFREYATARRSALRRTAYLMCGDWYLADDLVQDALAKLYVHWRRISAAGEVDPYVRRMLVNGYLATHRRTWRREITTADLPDRATNTNPDDGTRDLLLQALASLQPSQRTIVVLRYWEDLSIEQTAAALGCSTGNVKSQAARGLDHLRAALDSSGVLKGEPA